MVLINKSILYGFSNKIIKDTLFLFFKEADVGRGFLSFKESAPKVQSLFAKCFITINGQLSITYLNRKFIKAIKSHLNFSIREEEDLFPKIMYFVRVE